MTAMIELTHSQRLRLKLNLALPELGIAGAGIHNHPRLREVLPRYLFTTHCMIRASVPLMRVAAERSRELADTDPVGQTIERYFTKHIREEMHHDDWLLEDLAVLGYDPAELVKQPPSAAVAAMVG